MNRRIKTAAFAGSGVVIAILGVLAVRHREAPAGRPVAAQEAPSYWYDPMHPDRHFDKPGKSPFMDMQLVPKYPDRAASGGSASARGAYQAGRGSFDTVLLARRGLLDVRLQRLALAVESARAQVRLDYWSAARTSAGEEP